MLFNSLQFLVFFPIVCLVYFVMPKKARWTWLLVASYYFYMCWNAKYALLMFLSTFITWGSGIFITRFNSLEDEKKRRTMKNLTVAVSFVSNLAILFFFKYFNFVIDNLNTVLQACGMSVLNPSFDVILPVGISFYTFQALSYTMDIYRGEIKCEKNLFRYMLFVSFFPQLVAGPIERSKNLLGQLKEPKSFDFIRVRDGLLLMFWGLFQKLVIADRVAIIVNTAYNSYTEHGGTELLLATVCFALQIYCDFSSYTDIARGAAQVLGFNLMDNFKQPYFACSIAEFWRRWHISLSGWFKDYLYIPLGGNRVGTIRKYLNIMIVFLASGLWHGASWNFILWGALHGLYQILGALTLGARECVCRLLSINRKSHGHRIIQRLITFALVTFSWIFFRATNIGEAFTIVGKIFAEPNPWIFSTDKIYELGLDAKQIFVGIIAVIVLITVSVLHYKKISIRRDLLSNNIILRWSTALALIFAVIIFGIYGPGYNESQFIYFQF